jgi:hypothetical protein
VRSPRSPELFLKRIGVEPAKLFKSSPATLDRETEIHQPEIHIVGLVAAMTSLCENSFSDHRKIRLLISSKFAMLEI